MKACAIISVLFFISLVSALPARNGFYMPYYHPYHQAMLVHYAQPHYGRSASGISAFAAGDTVAAGSSTSVVRENQFPVEDVPHPVAQEQSNNDGNVEAIAEAYPEVPFQGAVQFDQGEEQYNEVIPLNVVPAVSETPNGAENIAPVVPLASFTPEPESKVVAAEEPQVQVQPTSAPEAPKKKVHIALDIPEKHDENDYDEDDDQYPYAPQKPGKPSRNGGSPVYTFFPVSFGRAAGGSIAVANAYSTGKGAVRSHAIAYGSNGSSRRQQSTERHTAV